MDKHKIYKQQLNIARQKLREQTHQIDEFIAPLISIGARLLGGVGARAAAGAAARGAAGTATRGAAGTAAKETIGQTAKRVAGQEAIRYGIRKGLGGSEPVSSEQGETEETEETISDTSGGGIDYDAIRDWMPEDPARNISLMGQKSSVTDPSLPAGEIGKSVNPYSRRRNPYTPE